LRKLIFSFAHIVPFLLLADFPSTQKKTDYPRNMPALFACKWLSGFREEEFFL
jgi:hypothetical protein